MKRQTNTSPRRRRTVRRATAIALAAATAVLGLTACDDSDNKSAAGGDRSDVGAPPASAPSADSKASGTGTGTKNQKLGKLLWMGDSIAEAEAPAIGAAMKAGGTEFKSMAAAGGGGVLGPPELAQSTWDQLPNELGSFKPNVVVYQITSYDWGKPEEQRVGYERLVKTVNDAGAELLIVSAPPFLIDGFYKPHEADIKTAPKSAKEVADKHPGKVRFLDAAALWGTDNAADKAQRSKDHIHSCPQGSAAFAQWLATDLAKKYGYTPAPVDQWATGSWTGDKVYLKLDCK
ncbi:SGNH/GDSL hydrolase family protein [Streptomyces sp. SID5474]|nr:SGNH/GDSL hydrolase family protein [Embleya scabrispora]MYS79255.1 SGNH/GDSL hydrolase family protein [Streptomyces sp. SID5474]